MALLAICKRKRSDSTLSRSAGSVSDQAVTPLGYARGSGGPALGFAEISKFSFPAFSSSCAIPIFQFLLLKWAQFASPAGFMSQYF